MLIKHTETNKSETSVKSQEPIKKYKEKIIYKHINVKYNKCINLDLDNDKFNNYINLENTFSDYENILIKRELIINKLEINLYNFNDLVSDVNFNDYFSKDILTNLQKTVSEDLDIYNLYKVEDFSTEQLEKKLSYFEKIESEYKQKISNEQENTKFVNDTIEKLIFI